MRIDNCIKSNPVRCYDQFGNNSFNTELSRQHINCNIFMLFSIVCYIYMLATISTLINVRALLAHAELGVGLMGMHCTCGSNIKLIMHSRIARCRHINCLFKEGAAS